MPGVRNPDRNPDRNRNRNRTTNQHGVGGAATTKYKSRKGLCFRSRQQEFPDRNRHDSAVEPCRVVPRDDQLAGFRQRLGQRRESPQLSCQCIGSRDRIADLDETFPGGGGIDVEKVDLFSREASMEIRLFLGEGMASTKSPPTQAGEW